MPFESSTYIDEPIYSDGYSGGIQEGAKGFIARNWYAAPYLSAPHTSSFPSELLVPQNEWKDRIEEKEKTKTRLSDIIIANELPMKNQQSTNYCWTFSAIQCEEVVHMLQGHSYLSLSPASIAAPIKGYRNLGGFGYEALAKMVEDGPAPTLLWPDTAIERKYDNPESRAARPANRVSEWIECRTRDLAQAISLCLNDIPCAVGYNWWRHEVMAVDAVFINNQYGLRIRNQWKIPQWTKTLGFGTLLGKKAVPDDCVAPVVAMPA